MSDQHNIDNFFRNRFKDFEPAPDPEVWNKISEKLDEKKAKEKKEGIVFLPWLYRVAGIAAAVVLLFFIGNTILDSNQDLDTNEQTTSTTNENTNTSDKNTNGTQNNSEVTNSTNDSQQNSLQNENNTTPESELQQKTQIVNEDTSDTRDLNLLQQTKDSDITKGNALQNAVAQQDASQSTSQETTVNRGNTTLSNQENAIANTTDQLKKNTNRVNRKERGAHVNNYKIKGQDYTSPLIESQKNTKNAVADTNQTNTELKNATAKGSEINADTKKIIETNATAVAQTDIQKNSNATDKAVTNASFDTIKELGKTALENTVAATEKENTEKETIKKSILDVINDLHELESNKTEVTDVPFNRWTLSPNASPVYYNAMGNGSPIHESFGDNTKTGDINLSYGVNVGYDVSKRLTVRSGIHRVDYSYSTKDIALVPSIDGPDVTTINFRANNVAFNIQDKEAPTNERFAQYQLPTTESSIFEKQIEGDLNQRMSFIEVPVEVKYALLDKKIGINVIGGVSTLLLTENSIVLDSPELLTELGEATNVNDVSFSTNIGLGIDYKFSKQLEFNLEPMLKYQLNTFSGNTGNFNPYSIGVYTGVSFRF